MSDLTRDDVREMLEELQGKERIAKEIEKRKGEMDIPECVGASCDAFFNVLTQMKGERRKDESIY